MKGFFSAAKSCDSFKARGIEHADLEAGYPVLPSALGAALGNPVSLLALEERRINVGLAIKTDFPSWKKGGLLEDSLFVLKHMPFDVVVLKLFLARVAILEGCKISRIFSCEWRV